MKVLHAITRLDKGGSSTNTLLSAIGLRGKGHSVDILSGPSGETDTKLIEQARLQGVRFFEERTLVRDIHPCRDIQAVFMIAGFLKKEKYDILHTHSSKAGALGRVAARMAGSRNVIYTPHGHVFYGYFNERFTHMITAAEKLLAWITDSIICLTDSEKAEWLERGIGSPVKYEVIPSGIDLGSVERRAAAAPDLKKIYGIETSDTVFGAAGRFVKIKGFEYFIRAGLEMLRRKDNVSFILAGGGEESEKYSKMVAAAGLGQRFHIVPWQEDPVALLRMLDVFVLPSLNEGMGRILAEAMYLEKPVIASRVGGVPGIVDKECGILVEPSSEKALLEAMLWMMSEPGARSVLGERARQKISKRFSKEIMVRELDKLYRTVARDKSGKGESA
jgi:glycosyltransferase involved in cell wall biosynthesis